MLKMLLCISKLEWAFILLSKAVIKGKKNEIILSPYTIFDVVNMVLCAGGKPIFVALLRKVVVI